MMTTTIKGWAPQKRKEEKYMDGCSAAHVDFGFVYLF